LATDRDGGAAGSSGIHAALAADLSAWFCVKVARFAPGFDSILSAFFEFFVAISDFTTARLADGRVPTVVVADDCVPTAWLAGRQRKPAAIVSRQRSRFPRRIASGRQTGRHRAGRPIAGRSRYKSDGHFGRQPHSTAA
jgi:hypothetical protein